MCPIMFRNIVNYLHKMIVYLLQQIARIAVLKPKMVLFFIPVISILSIVIGSSTNFYMESNEINLWTPYHSKALQHGKWLSQESGFAVKKGHIQIIIHAEGRNVLGRDGIDYTFKALDTVRSTKRFDESCTISGVVNFFNDDYDLFRKTIENDEDAIQAVSVMPYLPNGNFVNREKIFGYPIEGSKGMLQSVKSFSVRIDIFIIYHQCFYNIHFAFF